MDENIFLSYRAGRTEMEMEREERSKEAVERERETLGNAGWRRTSGECMYSVSKRRESEE